MHTTPGRLFYCHSITIFEFRRRDMLVFAAAVKRQGAVRKVWKRLDGCISLLAQGPLEVPPLANA